MILSHIMGELQTKQEDSYELSLQEERVQMGIDEERKRKAENSLKKNVKATRKG